MSRLEFHQSLAKPVTSVALDSASPLPLADFYDRDPAACPPLPAAQTFPVDGVFRRAFDLMQFEPFRELQIQLLTAAGKISARCFTASAFLNTLEAEA